MVVHAAAAQERGDGRVETLGHIGSVEVNPGDVLVGKVTPKGETELSAEELQSGSYLVRMTANETAYSMKFVVAK